MGNPSVLLRWGIKEQIVPERLRETDGRAILCETVSLGGYFRKAIFLHKRRSSASCGKLPFASFLQLHRRGRWLKN
jgi:hypothetical protein